MRSEWLAPLGGLLLIVGAALAPTGVHDPVPQAIDEGVQPVAVESRWICLSVPDGSSMRELLREYELGTEGWWYLTRCDGEPRAVERGAMAEALAEIDGLGQPFWYAAGDDRWRSLPPECDREEADRDVVRCLTR